MNMELFRGQSELVKILLRLKTLLFLFISAIDSGAMDSVLLKVVYKNEILLYYLCARSVINLHGHFAYNSGLLCDG